jgi:hypothetical protein
MATQPDPGPGRWAREIIARRALVVATITAAVHVAVVAWALPPTLDAAAPVAVGSILDLLGVVCLVAWGRTGVTPADPGLAPRSADGRAFVVTSAATMPPPSEWGPGGVMG